MFFIKKVVFLSRGLCCCKDDIDIFHGWMLFFIQRICFIKRILIFMEMILSFNKGDFNFVIILKIKRIILNFINIILFLYTLLNVGFGFAIRGICFYNEGSVFKMKTQSYVKTNPLYEKGDPQRSGCKPSFCTHPPFEKWVQHQQNWVCTQ